MVDAVRIWVQIRSRRFGSSGRPRLPPTVYASSSLKSSWAVNVRSGLSSSIATAEAWASPASALDSSVQPPKPNRPTDSASAITSGETAANSDSVVALLRASSSATSSSISVAFSPSI